MNQNFILELSKIQYENFQFITVDSSANWSKMVYCDVILDNSDGIFYAGQDLKGESVNHLTLNYKISNWFYWPFVP